MSGFVANTPGSARPRPIENRSRDLAALPAGPRGATELPFRRVGDVGRLLRFGHDGPGATNGRSAPEKLAAAANDGDAYVNLVEAKYNRLLPVLAVNHPYYDKTDSDGDGFIDALDTGRDRADSFGPEIYRHGMINIKTAPPEVIRGMVPLQVERHGHNAWTISKAIADNDAIKNPADILTLEHQSIFINDNRDDDDNGSPDDHAERTWLYGYMSNWATVRTDTFAVYGTISIETVSGRKEGVRRFIAVLDRVPATAYPPFLEIQAGKTRPDANPNYLPVRVANFMWLE